MKTLVSAAAIAASFALAGPVQAFVVNSVTTELKNPRPPESYQGQWWTTPMGCSYSRAQAPGYPHTWHLILNPHHIGKPPAPRGCPAML